MRVGARVTVLAALAIGLIVACGVADAYGETRSYGGDARRPIEAPVDIVAEAVVQPRGAMSVGAISPREIRRSFAGTPASVVKLVSSVAPGIDDPTTPPNAVTGLSVASPRTVRKGSRAVVRATWSAAVAGAPTDRYFVRYRESNRTSSLTVVVETFGIPRLTITTGRIWGKTTFEIEVAPVNTAGRGPVVVAKVTIRLALALLAATTREPLPA